MGGQAGGGVERRGLFISVEGIDGCGKTTQFELLNERLDELGLRPLSTREPGGTRVGTSIRQVLLDARNEGIQPMTELLLFFASRAQNLEEVIRPGLDAGRTVLCDRFTDASVAYQGYGRNLGADTVQQLSKVVCDGLQPDLTLWLDIEPETALARLRARNSVQQQATDRMESETLEFFQRVRDGYTRIHESEPGRVQRIDAEGSIEEVSDRVWKVVSEALPERGIAPASN